MKKIFAYGLLIAFSFVLLHNIVPHHHHDKMAHGHIHHHDTDHHHHDTDHHNHAKGENGEEKGDEETHGIFDLFACLHHGITHEFTFLIKEHNPETLQKFHQFAVLLYLKYSKDHIYSNSDPPNEEFVCDFLSNPLATSQHRGPPVMA